MEEKVEVVLPMLLNFSKGENEMFGHPSWENLKNGSE
jgi:hypothetical protein